MCAYGTTICRGLWPPHLPQPNPRNQFLLAGHVKGKVYSNTSCTKDNLEEGEEEGGGEAAAALRM